MDIKISNCFITVDDHDKALAFYHDVLGFEVLADVKMENFRWLTVAPKGHPEVSIVLESVGASPDVSPADREALSRLLAKGLLRALNFSTDDVDATFEHIKASGAELVQEPMDQFYGVRDCAFRDPAGNLVRFAQPKVS